MARDATTRIAMRPVDRAFAVAVAGEIAAWEGIHGHLPGLARSGARDCFIRQLVDSDRRRRYVEHYRDSIRLKEGNANPSSGVFNPFAAAVWHGRVGDLDEALWLVFLAVHFGRHPKARWRYVKRVYGRLDVGRWDWRAVATDTRGFRKWLAANVELVKGVGPSGFGNHRKRESLGDRCTGEAVESYVTWVGSERGHVAAFTDITNGENQTPGDEFDSLYESMRAVFRFGRLARFDYLTTASRLGLTAAVAAKPYLPESTGPLAGARRLFGIVASRQLEEVAVDFGNSAGIEFGVLEDALCNWQKNPDTFKRFRA